MIDENNLTVDVVYRDGEHELSVLAGGKVYKKQIDRQSLLWLAKRILTSVSEGESHKNGDFTKLE